MDSFDLDEVRKPSRKHSEEESKASKEVVGGEARPGNQAMQKLVPKLRVQMAGAKGADVDETIARAIQSKRGGGATLAEGPKANMEQTMGEDFSDVRVHNDSDADSLSKSVQAKAFTTGQDIFFRSGEYQPGSTDGNKLLAHELTHVVQQRNAPPAAKLEVSHPEDASEKQASAVADNMSPSAATAAPSVGREEEEVATSVARQDELEEKEEAAPTLARQEAVEQEEAATSVARAEDEQLARAEPAPEEEKEPEEGVAPTLAREGEEAEEEPGEE